MKPAKISDFWERLDHWNKFLAKIPFALSMLLIVGLMFLTAVDVIGRFFGRPISGSYQISELTQLWIICLAWPLSITMSSHVSVKFLTTRLSSGAKKVTGILAHLITMSVFAAIAWQGLEMVKRSWAQAELVNILDVPLYPFQVAVPIGAFIGFVVLLVQLCILSRKMIKGEEQ